MDCVTVFTGNLLSQLQGGAISALSSLQNLVTGRVWNLVNLGKTARLLEQKMTGLTELRVDLESQVEVAEIQPRMRRTRNVEGWIARVESVKIRVDAFRSSFQERRTFMEACSFESVYSNYVLGQEAADLLGEVNELKEERGGLSNLVMEAPPDAVVAVPGSATRIVGAATTQEEIQSCIEDEEVGVVGIWGMGGVGKTTLLKKVNDHFLSEARSKIFDMVIFVTVGKDAMDRKIQQDIGERLGFSRGGLPSDDADGRRTILYDALRKKRFMLLLDDIWAVLDLETIGIPNPAVETKRKCKVVFTTRNSKLCGRMGAQKTVNVKCLGPQDSRELFRSKVGAEVDLRDGSPLCPPAKAVAGRCGGLPLALVTLGLAMAGAKTAREWEDAVEQLKESPHRVEDVEEKVFFILKFSFDRLRDDNVRECFLYCCLFPEDAGISAEVLIGYWIGEGFISITERQSSLDTARRVGRQIITELKVACLLESVGLQSKERVRMHDVVRDMALWLRNGDGGNDLFLVHSVGEEGSAFVNNVERLEGAKRISVIPGANYNNKLLDLPERAPSCHNLQTLLMRGISRINPLNTTRDEFLFMFMPALRVLDLRGTHISQLPKEIGSLRELRYLNLKRSDLQSLPKELGNLTKLKWLDLSRSGELRDVPNGAILGLTQLQKLDLYECEVMDWQQHSSDEEDRGKYDEDDRAISLRGINCYLRRLEEFGVSLRTCSDLSELAGSDKLSKCTRLSLSPDGPLPWNSTDLNSALQRLKGLSDLRIDGRDIQNQLGELKLVSDGNQLRRLESLSFLYLPRTTRIVPPPTHQRRCLLKLGYIDMYECHGFRELTWTRHLPCLVVLELDRCLELEELLGDEDEICSDVSFPSLRTLYLIELAKLKSISRHALLLPSLERVYVVLCPKLIRLPFGAGSAKKLREIHGEQRWFDRLEWDHGDVVKDTFCSRFRWLLYMI